MYNFSNTLVETFKTFCMSFLCSAPLAVMLYREESTALFFATVCLVLNAAALLLFMVLYFKNWSWFYRRSFTTAEYAIPAATSFVIYAAITTILYLIASFPASWGISEHPLNTIRIIYRHVFQHARFLEPVLNTGYDPLSLAITYILMAGSLIIIPKFNQR